MLMFYKYENQMLSRELMRKTEMMKKRKGQKERKQMMRNGAIMEKVENIIGME